MLEPAFGHAGARSRATHVDAEEAAVAHPHHDPLHPRGAVELEELIAMRDELSAVPDLRVGEPSERARRATRSASAYLAARRARLKRELRDLRDGG